MVAVRFMRESASGDGRSSVLAATRIFVVVLDCYSRSSFAVVVEYVACLVSMVVLCFNVSDYVYAEYISQNTISLRNLMEGSSRNNEISSKLLHLIPQGRRTWFRDGKTSVYNNIEEKKLELKLGPPGEDEDDDGLSVIRHIKKEPKDKSILCLSGNHFSPSFTNKSTSQKRTAPGPVVGWPPVRSFRKNIANGSSSKLGNESNSNGIALKNQKVDDDNSGEKPMEARRQGGMFVKINMYGVPIGRKVDLNAHNSYEQLSLTVDKLFRGLLAAQRQSSSNGEEEKPISGLLDGNGEYTLTYEDNEGDKMLVGDVPWHMFVSSVRRLRVIKSSEISSALTYGKW